MSAEKPKLDSLFEAAIAIESAEGRAAFVQEKCGDDRELRAQLQKLLRSDEEAGSFLEKPPAGLEETILSGAGERQASLDAGLASAFARDEAVVMGDAGHSVLQSLGATIDVPRVILPQADVAGTPSERADLPETPQPRAEGRYRFDDEIARGGMGAIIKGHDNDLGRDLAIKVLLDSHQDRPEVIQRFIEEAQIGGQLQHPGIAPVYELGQFPDERPFFSMKLVKGDTLSELLANRKEVATDRGKFLSIFEQICQTMGYAHSRGVIHRDLKPANIMVGAFGEVQVMDWGLAKVLPTGGVAAEKKSKPGGKDASVIQTRRSTGSNIPGTDVPAGSVTQMGSVLGTPAYMPPEQALGDVDQLDQRADVFGLGAILCEILTGQPPYVGKDGTQVYRLASRGKLDDAFHRIETCGADAELIALATDCLAAERDDRPRNAGVVAAAVTAYQEGVQERLRQTELDRAQAEVRVVEEKKRLAIEQQRNRLRLSLATALLILVAGGSLTATWLMRVRSQRQAAAAEQQARQVARAEYLAAEVQAALQRAKDQRGQLIQDLRDQQQYFKYMSDMIQWRTRLNIAQASADRAKDLVATDTEGLLAAALREEVQVLATELKEDERHWQAAREFDRVRQQVHSLDSVGNHTDHSQADAKCMRAFRKWLAVDMEKDEERVIVERLGGLPHRLVLVATLDHWAAFAKEKLRNRLLSIARQVDADSLRDQIRNPKNWNRDSLERLARKMEPDKQSPQLLLLVAEILTAKGGDASEYLRAAIVHHPQDFWLHFMLGNVLEMRGSADERAGCFNAAVALRPTSPYAHNNWGVALAQKGNLTRAIARYQRAIELDPQHATAHNNWGAALVRKRKFRAGIAHYKRALEIHPKYANAHVNWGVALAKQGDFDRAIKHFEQAVGLNPRNADAHFNWGFTLNERSDLEGAIAHYKQALVLNPNHADTHMVWGLALGRTGQNDEAIARFQRAVQLDPGLAKAHLGWGLSLAQKGDYESALAQFQQSQSLFPPQDPFRRRLAALIQRAQQSMSQQRRRETRLSAYLNGAQLSSAGECLSLATYCAGRKKYYRTAVRLYAAAFSQDAKLANRLQGSHRYNAARAAAVAASGQGQEKGTINAEARAQLRRQAYDWLRADLQARAAAVQAAPSSAVMFLEHLLHMEADADLAGARESQPLAELTESERRQWRKLWSDVAARRKKARGSYAEKRIAGVLTRHELRHDLPCKAGKVYVIDMQSKRLDSLLKLEDKNGKLLVKNDDGGKGWNSRIKFSPSADGMYRVIAGSNGGKGRGNYEIVVREFASSASKK